MIDAIGGVKIAIIVMLNFSFSTRSRDTDNY